MVWLDINGQRRQLDECRWSAHRVHQNDGARVPHYVDQVLVPTFPGRSIAAVCLESSHPNFTCKHHGYSSVKGGVLMAQIPGVFKGLAVTFNTMMRTFKNGSNTVQYPREKEAPPIRARGVIALHEDNCTSCMLCSRSCPDWCIYIEAHKELAPPRREGGKPRAVNKLDRFDIDYALCMYCGICVEVCPFDALFWSFQFSLFCHFFCSYSFPIICLFCSFQFSLFCPMF